MSHSSFILKSIVHNLSLLKAVTTLKLLLQRKDISYRVRKTFNVGITL